MEVAVIGQVAFLFGEELGGVDRILDEDEVEEKTKENCNYSFNEKKPSPITPS
jgi:hypothetical protein